MSHYVSLALLLFVSFTCGQNVKNPIYLGSPEVTCNDIRFIVDYHNDLRRSVANGTLRGQPKASNMQTIVWDTNLAEIALNYSKKMIFSHNPNRDEERFAVGENIFMTASSSKKNTNVEWKRAIDAWFNEYKIYKYKPAGFSDGRTSHYTQLVWADTIYIGCGTTQFMDSRNLLYKLYVCNYGPSGNWVGQFPYFEDTPMDLTEILAFIPDFVFTNCDNLCCDWDQCSNEYGPQCSEHPTTTFSPVEPSSTRNPNKK